MATPALAAAYRAAHYVLALPDGEQRRRIGIVDASADAALRRAGCRQRWHYLTPFNPGSNLVDAASNQARLQDCARQIASRNWRCQPAYSQNRDGDWHESGFVIFDAAPAAVEALGRSLGQLAIVCGALDQPPRLVWL